MAAVRSAILLKDFPELPDRGQFDELVKRVNAELDSRVGPRSIDPVELFDAGIEFMRIWERLERLEDQFRKFRAFIQKGTDWSLFALETAEEASFLILDVAAQLRYIKQPLKKLALRLTVTLVRSSARGVGELMAGGEFFIAALKNFGGTHNPSGAARAPDILATGVVEVLNIGKWSKGLESVIKEMVALVFDGLLYAAILCHEDDWAPWTRAKGQRLRDVLVERAAWRMLDVVAAVLPKAKKGSAKEKVAEVAMASARSVTSDLVKCAQVASDENRPFLDVVIAECGTILVNACMAAVFAVFEQVLERELPKKFPDYFPDIVKRRSTPRPKKGRSKAQKRADKKKAARKARKAMYQRRKRR